MKNFFKRLGTFITSMAVIFTISSYFPLSNDVNAAVYGVWPTESKYKTITTYFDPARNSSEYASGHNAIDIPAPAGSNIYAVYNGEVVLADFMGDYGNLVIVYHADLGAYTFYAHASQLLSKAGDKVNQGDIIAKVGNTGNSQGNHLHFGVCDSLLGGYPSRMYYDPLSYFVYSDNDYDPDNGAEIPSENTTPPENVTPSCGCSEKYAGVYTTKGVSTYLNVRSDHNTNASIVGSIPANAEFKVTMGNGEWAHVEYNGIKGFASMAYMQLKKAQQTEQQPQETKSSMKIEGATAPTGNLDAGKSFDVRGVITSALPIKKVTAGVYFRNGEETSQCVEVCMSTQKYDLSEYFDANIVFGVLKEGEYTYKVTAEDSSGTVYFLVTSEFTIGIEKKPVNGDLSGDGALNIGDAVILQNYLLKRTDDFSKEQFMLSDLNGDGRVDVFDLVELKRAIINAE